MAHPTAVREKALAYYEQCKNISKVAEVFGVSRNTIYGWLKLKANTGSLEHRLTGGKPHKLDREKLIQYFQQNPDAYLEEAAQHFNCTAPTVCYALKTLGITRKKKARPTGSRVREK